MTYNACIIWMHGLGADASNMEGLADQLVNLSLIKIKHVFLDAPIRSITIHNGMQTRAWYNICGATLLDREDAAGILESQKQIEDAITVQINQGMTPQRIFLAGFSQGGAMALFCGINCTQQLAGIISLSAYLPLIKQCITNVAITIPIFMAYGQYDTIVQPIWTKHSVQWLQDHDYNNITLHEYSMEHSVCREEIVDLSSWLVDHIKKL